jgi:hypothetical protein
VDLDPKPKGEDNPKQLVTKEILELKLQSLRSDLRLMIIASVALNQFLANVTLPTAVTIPAITAAILAPLAKALFWR